MWGLTVLERAAMGLPDDWAPTIYQRVRVNTQRRWAEQEAARPAGPGRVASGKQAEQETDALQVGRGQAAIDPDMPDSAIRRLAKDRARYVSSLWCDLPPDPGVAVAWLNAICQPLGARPFELQGERPAADQLRGMLNRAQCDKWWRRQLRRSAVRAQQGRDIMRGLVSSRSGSSYVSRAGLLRWRERAASNAQMMATAQLENEVGQVMTLEQLAQVGTANGQIRRGELMTRVKGCEELGEAIGLRSVFLTLTAPSRFHAVLHTGAPNSRHDGSTPRDAQAWLCKVWARCRAALARAGIKLLGFRVAEPHHDGCPHWHALLWLPAGDVWRALKRIKRAWLKDAGDEPGARQHRVKAVIMKTGGATGYIAKYIAKNIDDAGAVGVEGHKDSTAADPVQSDLFGATAERVRAWASAWGIRQFQALGQPPVTVWRELRRVWVPPEEFPNRDFVEIHGAASRNGTILACWKTYLCLQGGPGVGRDYRFRIDRCDWTVMGSYEQRVDGRPFGVFDSMRLDPHGLPIIWPSVRRTWKPRGTWTDQDRAGVLYSRPPVDPWTRVNNCTDHKLPTMMDGRLLDPQERLMVWTETLKPLSEEEQAVDFGDWVNPPAGLEERMTQEREKTRDGNLNEHGFWCPVDRCLYVVEPDPWTPNDVGHELAYVAGVLVKPGERLRCWTEVVKGQDLGVWTDCE